MDENGEAANALFAEVTPVLEAALEAAWRPPEQFELPEFSPRDPYRIGLSGTGLCQRKVSYQWHRTELDEGWVAQPPALEALLGTWWHQEYLPRVAALLPDGRCEERVLLGVGDRDVSGSVDLVFRAPSGVWILLDYKTVSLRWLRSLRLRQVRINPQQWSQTRGYATAFREEIAATMLMHHAVKDVPHLHVMPPYQLSLSLFTAEHAAEVRRWYEVAAEREPSRVFRYRKPRGWWCQQCPWRVRCDADTAAVMPLDVRHDRWS